MIKIKHNFDETKFKWLKREELNILNKQNESTVSNCGYYVNIDGEDIEVDIKSNEEYSCIQNCLEGYYLYGNGRDDEDSNSDDDD